MDSMVTVFLLNLALEIELRDGSITSTSGMPPNPIPPSLVLVKMGETHKTPFTAIPSGE